MVVYLESSFGQAHMHFISFYNFFFFSFFSFAPQSGLLDQRRNLKMGSFLFLLLFIRLFVALDFRASSAKVEKLGSRG